MCPPQETCSWCTCNLQEGNAWDYVVDRHRKDNPLSAVEVLQLFIQLCDALEAMHTAAVALAHRDVKPHNILLRRGSPQPAPNEQARSLLAGTGDGAHLVAGGILSVGTGAASPEGGPQCSGGRSAGVMHAVLMDFGSAAPAVVHVQSRTDALALQEAAEVSRAALSCSWPHCSSQ